MAYSDFYSYVVG